MAKNILIVSHSFYPQNSPRSFRTTELAKELSRQGHKVTVITHKNNKEHISFEKDNGIRIKDLGKQKFKDINFSIKNKNSNLFKRAVRRGLLQLIQYPDIELMFLVNKALRKENNYDLLISIAVPYPIHWGVALARKEDNKIAKTWVADCGDPFYLATTDSFKKIFYFKYLEKWFSRKADYISIPFKELQKYFFKDFDFKYRIIPQGFNFDEVKLYNKPIKNKVVTFSFAGSFIKKKRDPTKLLDFLAKVDLPFRFIIYNNQKEFTNPYKSVLGDKLIVNEYIPRNELLFELSRMDFLVNIEFASNQAPSKLIDYSLTNRPILMIKNKEFNENIIYEFLNKNYKNQFIYHNLEKYNIKNVSNQFLELI